MVVKPKRTAHNAIYTTDSKCVGCKKPWTMGSRWTKGRCAYCYGKYREESVDPLTVKQRKRVCIECGHERQQGERWGSQGMCCACYQDHRRNLDPEANRKALRKSYKKHRERRKADSEAWRKNNPEKYREMVKRAYWKDPERSRRKAKAWINKHPEKQLEYRMRNNFGLKAEVYTILFKKQKGRCANCGCKEAGSEKQKNMCVDHDYDTLHVRGLLCHKCNRGLGLLGDTVESIAKSLKYVTKARNKPYPWKIDPKTTARSMRLVHA